MMNEELSHKDHEQIENDRKIEDVIEAIFNDPKKDAYAISVADSLGLHRNTVTTRSWHLTRPLDLGERYFTANELVSTKGLLGEIKEYRAKNKIRRTKKQLRQAEALTENVAGLDEILANMQEDNARLLFEIEEIQQSLKFSARNLEQTETALNKRIVAAKAFREERHTMREQIEDLKDALAKLGSSRGNKGSLAVLKPLENSE